ncbi:OLC1v1036235C1 [Oldenlandia corymbosa var. corymbosa]|uniref:OLC1v1036235C1 n=1 Tax=Oldenlandia corymbosa var. corymbosa TaxID=529605 RepID=A0AAV1CUU1_OLDCO|nr:OLC1v1036235C1 [Oldenlandia corymbosa var. corymbosa]
MTERIKRLRKELRKLKDGISPLERSGHQHAVTRNLYAEHRVEKEKNLKKVKNVHHKFGPLGELANVDDDDNFEGEESAEDSFESGGDDVDKEDEAAEYSSPERRDIHFGGNSVLNPIGRTDNQTPVHPTRGGGGGETLVGLSALNSAYTPGGSSVRPRSRFGGTSIGASSRPEAAASSSGTSRRSKVSTKETDDWVVTDDVPGGPCDGSVIPSFLGHTDYQLWNGEPRDYLTMNPAKKSLSRLHGWYARLSENAQLQIQNTGSPRCSGLSLGVDLVSLDTLP